MESRGLPVGGPRGHCKGICPLGNSVGCHVLLDVTVRIWGPKMGPKWSIFGVPDPDLNVNHSGFGVLDPQNGPFWTPFGGGLNPWPPGSPVAQDGAARQGVWGLGGPLRTPRRTTVCRGCPRCECIALWVSKWSKFGPFSGSGPQIWTSGSRDDQFDHLDIMDLGVRPPRLDPFGVHLEAPHSVRAMLCPLFGRRIGPEMAHLGHFGHLAGWVPKWVFLPLF